MGISLAQVLIGALNFRVEDFAIASHRPTGGLLLLLRLLAIVIFIRVLLQQRAQFRTTTAYLPERNHDGFFQRKT